MARRFRNLVGPRVRKCRGELGLTQDQLAARLQLAGLDHFDRVAVAKLESQIRSVQDYEVIVLARVLRMEAGDLLAIPYSTIKSALPKLLDGEL